MADCLRPLRFVIEAGWWAVSEHEPAHLIPDPRLPFLPRLLWLMADRDGEGG